MDAFYQRGIAQLGQAPAVAPVMSSTSVPAAAPSKPRRSLLDNDAFWGALLSIGMVAAAAAYKHMRKRPARSNPDSAPEFYKKFHWGRRHQRTKRVALAKPARELVQLGELHAVTYTAKKGRRAAADYHHEFESPKPVLAANPKTKELHIIGGGYDIKPEGIVG